MQAGIVPIQRDVEATGLVLEGLYTAIIIEHVRGVPKLGVLATVKPPLVFIKTVHELAVNPS